MVYFMESARVVAEAVNQEAAGHPAASGEARVAESQWEQDWALPESSAVLKLEPHPQPLTAFGLFTVKPAPMSVST